MYLILNEDIPFMRTFIAVVLPDAVREQLENASRALRGYLHEQGAPDRLRWTSMENAHLTLRFLGETSPEQVEALASELSALARKHPPFELSIGGLGCFPNVRQPRVVWVGIGGELARLCALQTAVERASVRVGFEAENRPYSPHVTLARSRRGASKSQLHKIGQLVQARIRADGEPLLLETYIPLPVDQVIHIRSDLRPGGSVYTPLRHFPLLQPD